MEITVNIDHIKLYQVTHIATDGRIKLSVSVISYQGKNNADTCAISAVLNHYNYLIGH